MAERKDSTPNRGAIWRMSRGGPTVKQMQADARARGDKTFDPGVPCVNGHVSPRWACNGSCVECLGAATARYVAENKERLREKARSRRHGKEGVRPARVRKKGTLVERQREYYRMYSLKNREKLRARSCVFRRSHPELARLHEAKRRAREIDATVGDKKSLSAYLRWAGRAPRVPCYWCKVITKVDARHVDHIIPLSKGGPHAAGNLCVSCPPCNLRKRAHLPEVFAGQAELRLA